MKTWQKIQSGFRALFQKERLDQEMGEEMRAHIELRTQANIEAGMKPEEARYAALRSFGGMEQVTETCRDLRGVGWIETLWQDTRFGLRQMRRNPGVTGVMVLILALGIGASTTVLSIVEAVLGKCPYQDSESLVWLWETKPAENGHHISVSGPTFLDWRAQNSAFEQVAGDTWGQFHLMKTPDAVERCWADTVSPEFFSLLRVKAALGRTFLPEDAREGAEPVVMLSHNRWQRWFKGDPQIIGQTVTLGEENCTVIGVLPASFRYVIQSGDVDVWRPFKPGAWPDRGERCLRGVLARLKPGVTLARAQAEMEVIANRLARAYPATLAGFGAEVVPMSAEYGYYVKDSGNALWLLWGIVNAVLLIGCLNVANLLLIRAVAREQEMAIRVALGGGRMRLFRQLLTECFLLAGLGGGAGAILSYWALKIVSALRGQPLPFRETFLPWFVEVRWGGRALLYALAVSVLTCALFALGPALGAVKTNLTASLSGAWSAGRGSRFRRALALFVVSETAIACVLLIGAGLLVNSALRLQGIRPGCNPRNVLELRISFENAPYRTEPQQKRYFQEVLARLRTLPGVAEAAFGGPTLTGGGSICTVKIEGEASAQEHDDICFTAGSPESFRLLQVPLLQGRFFTERDDETAPPVLIINEALARRYWPDGHPLGRHVTARVHRTNWISFEVVGVVGSVYNYRLQTASPPETYTCWRQHGLLWCPAIRIRTVGDAAAMKGVVVRTMRAVDDRVLPPEVETLEEGIARNTWSWPRQFTTIFLGGFAAVAFLLAMIGIYGVTAYSVSQRTREIGLRLALGAQRQKVLALVLRQGMSLAAVGVVIGTVAGLGLTRVVRSLLFGIAPTDPPTFVLIVILIGAVAFLACWFPARRAARIDPIVALRYE
jgi:putative ABC transport system permease protein